MVSRKRKNKRYVGDTGARRPLRECQGGSQLAVMGGSALGRGRLMSVFDRNFYGGKFNPESNCEVLVRPEFGSERTSTRAA